MKQYAFGSSGSNGTADAVLDVRVALPGSGGVISSSSGSNTSQTGTVTATLSNFVSQLRIGDIVEFTIIKGYISVGSGTRPHLGSSPFSCAGVYIIWFTGRRKGILV